MNDQLQNQLFVKMLGILQSKKDDLTNLHGSGVNVSLSASDDGSSVAVFAVYPSEEHKGYGDSVSSLGFLDKGDNEEDVLAKLLVETNTRLGEARKTASLPA